MAQKNYTVVVLPHGDQSSTIDINKHDIYESFDEAFEAVVNVVYNSIGKYPDKPKAQNQPYTIDTGAELVQIWICNLPVFNQ